MALWRPPWKSKFTLETRIPRGDFRPAEPQISHAYPASQGSVFKCHPASERQCGLPLPPASSLLCGFQECPGARVLSPATHVLLRLPTLTVS